MLKFTLFSIYSSEYIHQGHVRSKKKGVKPDKAGSNEDVSQVHEDEDAIKSLQVSNADTLKSVL